MSAKPKKLPSLDVLRARYSYDPETGELRNLVGYRNVRLGGIAGSLCPDNSVTPTRHYRVLNLGGQNYKAHRIAWLMHHGYDPGEMLVDHKNGNSLDNRAENLRLATGAQNSQNQSKNANNSCGSKGVVQVSTGKWVAKIGVNRKRIHVGTYLTREEAEAAYFSAAMLQHGNFART